MSFTEILSKKAGTSRSKKKSTVSKKSYAAMKRGFKKK
jgi:hypothetical protein